MGAEVIARAVGDQEWLDPIATPLQKWVRQLFEAAGRGGREAKNFLHGSALGHPLHPALIDLPLGAWTMAAIFDGIELASGKKRGRLADTAIKVGLIGAVGAAVAGLTDWSETDGRAKRIGIAHGVMNLTATGLYALSLWFRKKSRTKAIGISMTAYAVSMSAAFLGGHLTYGEQIGVDHTATPDATQPEDFRPVIAEANLRENTPTRVEVQDTAVVLVKRGGRI